MFSKFIPVFLSLLITYSYLLAKEIRNGYANELSLSAKCIKNLEELIEIEINPRKKHKLIRILLNIRKNERRIKKLFKKTEAVIEEFKIVDPGLYNKVNILKNKNGDTTDVYVRVVRMNKNSRIAGATYIDQHDDKNVCRSAFGSNSVVIELEEKFDKLTSLAHEFGHLEYIVPNFAEYYNYYIWRYKSSLITNKAKGHYNSDPSGHQAALATNNFIQLYKQYLQKSSKGVK